MPRFSRRTTAPSRIVRIDAPTTLSAAVYWRKAAWSVSQLVSACAEAAGAATTRANAAEIRDERMLESTAGVVRVPSGGALQERAAGAGCGPTPFDRSCSANLHRGMGP